jgi:transposase
MMINLYLKIHNITGLMYLGKTKQDPYTYKGSGKRWLNHLAKHGNDVTTKILRECSTNEEVKEWGLYYSKVWDIVNNFKFANLVEESGSGGDTSASPSYIKGLLGRNLSSNPNFIMGIKNRDVSKIKALRAGKSPTIEHKLRWYNDGHKNVYVTEGTQPTGYVVGRLMPTGRVVRDSSRLKASITNGKPCVSPIGETFHSTKAAAEAYGISDVAIRGLIKRGKSGWKYL